MMPTSSRRGLLLGGAALALSGCETIDGILGDKKTPLPGERLPVIQQDRELAIDPATAGRPVQLPAPVMRTEWPFSGGTLSHDPGPSAVGAGLREVWRASIGTGSSYRRRITGGPIVANDTVFAADAFGTVSAFDTGRGGRRWQRETTPDKDDVGAVGAGLAFADGTLYVATGMAEVLALDPGTGEVRWRAPVGAPTRGAPSVVGGRIFVPTVENQLVALSTEDGRSLWTYRSTVVSAVPLGLPAPAVEGESVVAGLPSGELAALRASDGRVIWTESLSAGPGGQRGSMAELAGVRGLPVITDGRVFASGQAGTSLMVDLRSGRRLWERDVGSNYSPAVAGEWIFVVTPDSQLVALGRADGRVRWVTVLDERNARDRRRNPLTFGSPLVAGGSILVPSSGGELLVVDPAEGAVSGRVRLPDGATLQPIAAGGTVYLVTDGGTLVALRGA
ncbi:dehydrogenase [Roseomonas sp. KE2513]|uniref:outer membrane protein assembly factor BamB family protein n=1 Tax=Roseomonas sp. KE2513 TaxID=2479202 RepID=UPI0018DEFD41|nr:PQQ-binding-like beta-propeller repeat protein [Roseomonas sp. KE2513]MBI0535988.1 dehydrogenase [Roseomonas sp. KE2513]